MKTFCRSLLGLFTVGFFINPGYALTVPVAQDTYTSISTTGTSIAASSGAGVSLPVTARNAALIQFDFENLNAVPAAITSFNISSALLQIYVTGAAPVGNLTVHAITTPWSEHFTGKPVAAPTIDPTVLATIPAASLGKKDFVTVDITAAVQAALASGSNQGFAIETTGTTKVAIASKEGPASGYAAQLIIDAGNSQGTNSDTATGNGALSAIRGIDTADAALGVENTAYGNGAMQNEATGSFNTAFGFGAMLHDTAGTRNTAFGFGALGSGTNSVQNTALGQDALSQVQTTSAQHNTAVGLRSLGEDQSGGFNVAVGDNALFSSTNGASNVAVGASAIFKSQGNSDTAVGFQALQSATTGDLNTALGRQALNAEVSGNDDIAVGQFAGSNNLNGNDNIYIGNAGGSQISSDSPNESDTIRIGAPGVHAATFIAGIVGESTGLNNAVPILIDSTGNLGTVNSSRRYKQDIADMGDASDRLFKLRPVTFRYIKPYADGTKPIQYGLIAEDVAQVFPDLVVLNAKGKPETVKYQLLGPLLLNEFLKEHQRVLAQAESLATQEKEIAGQRKTNEMQEQRIAAQEKSDAALQTLNAQEQKQIEALTTQLNAVAGEMRQIAKEVGARNSYQPVANVQPQ